MSAIDERQLVERCRSGDERAFQELVDTYKGLVFVVSAHRDHVTLGLAGGAALPDPAGLMQGAGKVHRHVKLRGAEDLARPELRALLTAALAR